MEFSPKELEFLKKQQVGRLATVAKELFPHVTPLCYATDGERLYLNTAYDSKKARNIKVNSNVSFVIDEFICWGNYRGVVVYGKAEFVLGGKLHQTGRDLIYKKYPKWQENYPIQEGNEYILVITPTKIVSWGFSPN